MKPALLPRSVGGVTAGLCDFVGQGMRHQCQRGLLHFVHLTAEAEKYRTMIFSSSAAKHQYQYCIPYSFFQKIQLKVPEFDD